MMNVPWVLFRLWLGMRDSTYLRQARNFCLGNKLPGEGFLANSPRLFSPQSRARLWVEPHTTSHEKTPHKVVLFPGWG